MADMPLCGVANRDLNERWHKWRRRRRYQFFRVKTMLVAWCAVVAIAALIWIAFLSPRLQGAGQALLEGKILLARHDYRGAARALTRGTALIEGIPGSKRLSRELATALRLADRVEEADRLHRLVDRLRFAESAAIRPDRVSQRTGTAVSLSLGLAALATGAVRNARSIRSSKAGAGTTCSTWR